MFKFITYSFIILNVQKILAKPQISLEYKPLRPSYASKPGATLSQIHPPGKPWPANAAGYTNFTQNQVNLSQTPPAQPGFQSDNGEFVNRKKPNSQTDLRDTITEIFGVPPTTTESSGWGFSRPGVPTHEISSESETKTPWHVIEQTYFPTRRPAGIYVPNPAEYFDQMTTPRRPDYAHRPDFTLQQIVPPGPAWPARPSEAVNLYPWAQNQGLRRPGDNNNRNQSTRVSDDTLYTSGVQNGNDGNVGVNRDPDFGSSGSRVGGNGRDEVTTDRRQVLSTGRNQNRREESDEDSVESDEETASSEWRPAEIVVVEDGQKTRFPFFGN